MDWETLSTDVRCEIFRRMPSEKRLVLWMMYDDSWKGIFNSDVKKKDVEYIARIWCVRDAQIETKIRRIVGENAMICAAALRGYEDCLENVQPDELQDVCYWITIGGHESLLRDIISRTLHFPSEIGSCLWAAVACKNNASMALKLVEWKVHPTNDAAGEAAYKTIGEYMAKDVLEVLIKVIVENIDGIDSFADDAQNRGLSCILHGCLFANSVDARPLFNRITGAFQFSDTIIYEHLEAAITCGPVEDVEREALWFVRMWIELTMSTNYDHAAMLSYIAQEAIERNDEGLLAYVVNGALWGEWELSEAMLWSACQYGTLAQVQYLLANQVPSSSRAYQFASAGKDAFAKMDCLNDNDVPLEDLHGGALLMAVSSGTEFSIIERLIQMGAAVNFKVVARSFDKATYDLLMQQVPEARHAEFKDYVFYDALEGDYTERINLFFDNFGWAIPQNFFYRCCMLNAKRTFCSIWQRGIARGGKLIEEGIAHHPSLCDFVWQEKHPSIKIDWVKVVSTAIDQRKQATLKMMEALLGPQKWREIYPKALAEFSTYTTIPFPDL